MVHPNLAGDRRPAGWEEGALSRFIETSWGNSLATYERQPELCAKLEQVDAIFERLGPIVASSSPHSSVVPPLLFGRASTAFKAGASLSLCMGTDAFGPIRSCLEHGAYAHLMATSPPAEKVWLDSTEGAEGRKARRIAFTTEALKKSIDGRIPKLGATFEMLYLRALEFGAHPNPHGVFSQTSIDESAITLSLLSNDQTIAQHTLKSCAQSGLLSAILFIDIFADLDLWPDVRDLVREASEDL